MNRLAEAEKALATKPERALQLLHEVWSETWDPEVALLIERLGPSVGTPLQDLPLKQSDRAVLLAERAQKSTVADRSSVLAAFEAFAAIAQGSKVWPSLEAWLEVEPDPRVARTALTLLSKHGAVRDLTVKLWRRLVSCVERHGHVGLRTDLDAYLAVLRKKGGMWESFPTRLENVIKRLGKLRTPRPVDDPNALARLLKVVRAPASPEVPAAPGGVEEPAFIEAIVARPDDDAPRLMYADWLTARQDPRGELIVLQVNRARGTVSRPAQQREAQLLAEHRLRCLGGLAGAVHLSGLRFERGFLVKCGLSRAMPEVPETGLLEDVTFGTDPGWLEGAKLGRLRIAREIASPAGIFDLLNRAPLLERVSLVMHRRVNWPLMRRELARPAPRSLKHFSLRPHVEVFDTILGDLFSMPLCSKLETLELQAGDRFDQATLQKAPATLTRLIVHCRAQDVAFELTRTAEGWSQLSCEIGAYASSATMKDLIGKVLASFQKAPLRSAHFTLAREATHKKPLTEVLAGVKGFSAKVEIARAKGAK